MKLSLSKINLLHLLVIFYLSALPLQAISMERNTALELELDQVIKHIKEKEKTLKTVTVKFRQTKNTYLLHEPLHSEGLIYFDASGKLLMKVTRPSPLLILFKYSTILVYYPEISKTQERYIGNVENIIKKYLGIGQPVEALKEQYKIRLLKDTKSDGYHLKMTPQQKSVAKHMDSIDVFVKPETWLPERIVFTEVKGDKTELWLQFISINQPLPSGIFSIVLPDESNDNMER